MQSSAMQTPFLDEKIKNNTIQFIKKFQKSHIKYFSLQGEWKFSKSEIHGPEHLYLYLRQGFKPNTALSSLIEDIIVEISEQNGNLSAEKLLTPDALFHGIHSNFSIPPYFIKIEQGICLDILIQAAHANSFATFLLGTHPRVGEHSSIRKFVTSKIYDINSLVNIFTFYHQVKESQHSNESKNVNKLKRKRN